jgi:hypothetical protein
MLHGRRISPEEHLAYAGADDKGEDEDNLKGPGYHGAFSVRNMEMKRETYVFCVWNAMVEVR